MAGNRKLLCEKVEELCLLWGKYILSTGQESDFYFDCKRATLDGECLSMISDAFLEEIAALKLAEPPQAVGGLTIGADFIVAGIIQRAHERGMRLSGSIVRKEPKKHGTRSKIENELPAGTPIVVVEDVFTSGKSTITAGRELINQGYRIVGIVGLVDREEQDGVENLRREFGCPVSAVFRKSEFPALNAAAARNLAATA